MRSLNVVPIRVVPSGLVSRDNLPSLTQSTSLRGWAFQASEEIEAAGQESFPECVARVPVSFGGLGVRLCSRKVVSMFATVRNRPQPFATVRNRLRERRKALHSGKCAWSDPESV